jgi:hypothetical protein
MVYADHHAEAKVQREVQSRVIAKVRRVGARARVCLGLVCRWLPHGTTASYLLAHGAVLWPSVVAVAAAVVRASSGAGCRAASAGRPCWISSTPSRAWKAPPQSTSHSACEPEVRLHTAPRGGWAGLQSPHAAPPARFSLPLTPSLSLSPALAVRRAAACACVGGSTIRPRVGTDQHYGVGAPAQLTKTPKNAQKSVCVGAPAPGLSFLHESPLGCLPFEGACV